MKDLEKSCPAKAAENFPSRLKSFLFGRRPPAGVRDLLKKADSPFGDRHLLLGLALMSILLFLVPICFIDLQGGDETRVAGIAAEMALDGDLLMPKLNGAPFLEYPPLFYAAVAACYRLFGFTPFAAKLPAALSALAGVLLLYAAMRFLRRSKREAFAAAFMLATGAQYLTNSFDCRVDLMLTAFCTLAWAGFALMEFSGPGLARRSAGLLMLAAGIAGGVLTKNLPGLAIPLSGIGGALVFRDLAERRFSFAAYCRLAGAVLLGLLPYLFYLRLLYLENGMSAVETVFLVNNFGRFSGSQSDHSSPWWGYLVRLPELFPPYLPLLLGGLYLQYREFRRERSPQSILLPTLLLIPFLMLSAASGKRMVYLLPLAAPAAMLAATTLPHIVWFCRRRARRSTTAWIAGHLKYIIGLATVLISLIAGAAVGHISHRDSFAPAFAEAEARLRALPGSRLVLIRPSERLQGAAVFYHRAVTAELAGWEDLRPGDVALARLGKKEPLPKLPEGFAAQRFPRVKLVLVSPLPR